MRLLELKNVTKRFGGLVAVNGISMYVEKGEIFGLIGPNGSGKTTIFNCINNFYSIDSGEIIFKRVNIEGMSTHKICKLGVARTFQVVKPLRRLTVLENVMSGAFLRTNRVTEAEKIAMEVVEFCGLEEHRNMRAKDLPIAGKKRVEVARALATKPDIILLDETAAGLNPRAVEDMIEIVKNIRGLGITCLVVEHVMKFLMAIADRIMCINYGQEVITGTPAEVINHREVIKAYLGEDYVRS